VRRATAWLTPGTLDRFPLCFAFRLVIDRSAQQRKLNWVHERSQKFSRSSDIGFGDVVHNLMQFFSDSHNISLSSDDNV
jgi:hypothetical protein